MSKRAYIKTYGCQMNVYDSQRMADSLAAIGYGQAACPEEADLVVLNTCHIREKAAEKVYSELGKLRRIKAAREKAGGDLIVTIAGCVAQAEGEEMVRGAPVVDLVIGPQSYHRLPAHLARLARRREAIIATDFPPEDKFEHSPEPAAGSIQ